MYTHTHTHIMVLMTRVSDYYQKNVQYETITYNAKTIMARVITCMVLIIIRISMIAD